METASRRKLPRMPSRVDTTDSKVEASHQLWLRGKRNSISLSHGALTHLPMRQEPGRHPKSAAQASRTGRPDP